MKRMVRNILNYPLDGHSIVINTHTIKKYNGLEVQIISESKNMLKIEGMGRVSLIPKKDGRYIFLLQVPVCIDGNLLIGTSKSRKKKKLKSW